MRKYTAVMLLLAGAFVSEPAPVAAQLKFRHTYIVTSPLWPEPVEVTVEVGSLESAFAMAEATDATVWVKADYEKRVLTLPGIPGIWKHPITPQEALANAQKRMQGCAAK